MTWRLLTVVLLSLGGLAVIVHNGRKLISDWPRPKPRHNVDRAWIQVYLGLAALVIAWIAATNPAHALFEPAPMPVSGEAAAAQTETGQPAR
jgi:hypothetical protein